MAPTLALTEKTFASSVSKGGILFIDFWAGWCAPCRAFSPVYEAAAKKHPDVIFGKLDVDAEEDLADDFDIQGIPTLVAIRDGVVVARETGAMPAKMLEQFVAGVRALDMDAVRADLAAEEKKAKASAKKKPVKKPVAKKAAKAKPAAKKQPSKRA